MISKRGNVTSKAEKDWRTAVGQLRQPIMEETEGVWLVDMLKSGGVGSGECETAS